MADNKEVKSSVQQSIEKAELLAKQYKLETDALLKLRTALFDLPNDEYRRLAVEDLQVNEIHAKFIREWIDYYTKEIIQRRARITEINNRQDRDQYTNDIQERNKNINESTAKLQQWTMILQHVVHNIDRRAVITFANTPVPSAPLKD